MCQHRPEYFAEFTRINLEIDTWQVPQQVPRPRYHFAFWNATPENKTDVSIHGCTSSIHYVLLDIRFFIHALFPLHVCLCSYRPHAGALSVARRPESAWNSTTDIALCCGTIDSAVVSLRKACETSSSQNVI